MSRRLRLQIVALAMIAWYSYPAMIIRCLSCGRRTERHRSGRCPSCRRRVNNARDAQPHRRAMKAARYDRDHRQLRAAWAPIVGSGVVTCARSSTGECLHADPLILPGQEWDLDHLDDGTERPSHAACNRSARRDALSAPQSIDSPRSTQPTPIADERSVNTRYTR